MVETPRHKHVRSDAGTVRLSERDVAALTWIVEQHTIRFDHLQLFLGGYNAKDEQQTPLSVTATRHALERWQKADFIARPQKLLSDKPSYIWLSKQGLKNLGLPYDYTVPLITDLPLYDEINRLRLHLYPYYSTALWKSERAMLLELPPQNRAYMRMHPFMPHAELIIGRRIIGLAVLLHMPESPARYILDLAGQYGEVWYYIHPSILGLMITHLTSLLPRERTLVLVHNLETLEPEYL